MFADWPLRHGAEELVQHVHSKGYATALITGSVDMFAKAIAQKLDIRHWYANTELVWNDSGDLVDFHYVRKQGTQKLAHLEQFTQAVNIAIENCVVIGDGDNDLEIFKATGKGIAIGTSNQQLKQVAWMEVDTLEGIIKLI